MKHVRLSQFIKQLQDFQAANGDTLVGLFDMNGDVRPMTEDDAIPVLEDSYYDAATDTTIEETPIAVIVIEECRPLVQRFR